MKIAPASSAPRRREHALDLTAAEISRDPDPGFQPHRSCAASARSVELVARQVRELARQPFGYFAGDRQFAVALEALDREPRVRIINTGRLELAITVFAERA